MSGLVLPEDVLAEVSARCLAEHPREACGLLLGAERDGARLVERALHATNLERVEPERRYRLDPADFLAFAQVADAAGMEMVGVYHSHPDGSTRPSELDHAAAEPGWSYLVLGVGGVDAPMGWRSWVVDPDRGRLVEETVSVSAATAPPSRCQATWAPSRTC